MINAEFVFFNALFLVCIFFCCFGCYKTATSDGQIDYFNIEYDTWGKHQLIGHRKWRFNRVISSGISSIDDVIIEAKKINCEIK